MPRDNKENTFTLQREREIEKEDRIIVPSWKKEETPATEKTHIVVGQREREIEHIAEERERKRKRNGSVLALSLSLSHWVSKMATASARNLVWGNCDATITWPDRAPRRCLAGAAPQCVITFYYETTATALFLSVSPTASSAEFFLSVSPSPKNFEEEFHCLLFIRLVSGGEKLAWLCIPIVDSQSFSLSYWPGESFIIGDICSIGRIDDRRLIYIYFFLIGRKKYNGKSCKKKYITSTGSAVKIVCPQTVYEIEFSWRNEALGSRKTLRRVFWLIYCIHIYICDFIR